jgi:hypothetical protein
MPLDVPSHKAVAVHIFGGAKVAGHVEHDTAVNCAKYEHALLRRGEIPEVYLNYSKLCQI